MIWLLGLLVFSALASVGALLVAISNLRLYRPTEPLAKAEDGGDDAAPVVSVCVPARNEESNLEACVGSLLSQDFTRIEVLVYDDGSDDRTPDILRALAARDARVGAVRTEPLPDGWNGKQHACWQMSRHARGKWMLFTDADVRFEPSAVRRSLAYAERSGAALVSTFPRQITETLGEKLIVPMIFFVLFSYLPMGRMRHTTSPSASAACGQFILARRDAYEKAGTHAAVRDSMHEGVKLPRLVRAKGFSTDLFDGTDLCSVRMYEGLGQTWRGFTKNAYEGLGGVPMLLFVTALHVFGQLAPWVVLVGVGVAAARGGWAWSASGVWIPALAGVAVVAQLIERFLLARRLATSRLSAWLHPVGLVAMTLIQWHSLLLDLTGRRTWRGRTQGRSAMTS